MSAPVQQLSAALATAVAAAQFGVARNDLISHRRERQLIRARAFAVWALRSFGGGASYPAIGRALGDRDHSTIINLHRKAIRLRLEDAQFAAACNGLAVRFNQLRELDHGQG